MSSGWRKAWPSLSRGPERHGEPQHHVAPGIIHEQPIATQVVPISPVEDVANGEIRLDPRMAKRPRSRADLEVEERVAIGRELVDRHRRDVVLLPDHRAPELDVRTREAEGAGVEEP